MNVKDSIMKKSIFMVILMFSSLYTHAQDWCSWSFQYDFKIKSNGKGEYLFPATEKLIQIKAANK